MSWSRAVSGYGTAGFPCRVAASRWLRQAGLPVLALVMGASVLSGCTLTPVYGDHGLTASQLKLDLAAPANRLEQVVYQRLALRFGTSDGPDAPRVSVKVSATSSHAGQSATADPEASQIETGTAVLTISRPGKPDFTATRQVSVTYTTSGQVLANNEARTDAGEQAARALAEQLRLTILSVLAHPGEG